MRHLIILLFMCIAQVAIAQTNTAKLDSLFYQLEKNNKAMLQVCIRNNQETVYQKAIGFATIDTKQKANTETIYPIGSISKMFTAVVIFQLVEEKKLRLETLLSTYFPNIPESKNISIEHLLSHRSGIFNITNDSTFSSYQFKTLDGNHIAEKIASFPRVFESGTRAQYSNSNYILLGLIIEKITGKSLAEEIDNRICKKLRLQHTTLSEAITPEEGIAKSYIYENDTWKEDVFTNRSIPRGAGAMQSTASELCTFLEGLFHGKLLSDTVFQEMIKIEDGFGRGIITFPFGTRKAYGHNGSIDGFRSALAYFPEDKMCFSIVANGMNYNFNSILLGMLSIYFNKSYTIPTFDVKKPSTQNLKTIEGIYANEKIDMKITITKNGDTYMAQATGQSAFPLKKESELVYTYSVADLELKFKKEPNGDIRFFTSTQKGSIFTFEKE